jgi:hypothetical protein
MAPTLSVTIGHSLRAGFLTSAALKLKMLLRQGRAS